MRLHAAALLAGHGINLLLLLLLHVLIVRDLTEGFSISTETCSRCLPNSECWPDDETWANLNTSVGGRLLRPRPSAAPCHHTSHDTDHNASACADAVSHWHDAFWRADQAGAMQVLNTESDGDLACRLPSSDQFAYTACDQGAVPTYAIRVSEASDVQAGISFATQHNLRLTIKSTGHDIMGRSIAPASLNIWMHHLKGIEFHEEFRAEGCGSSTDDEEEVVEAVTAEAGVQWDELYEAADARERVVVGAMSGSVSTAGGYLQGGGHSPLSPLLGLAADNILEMKVVTADGSLVTANACQNKDLFWALRGGGGSTYGVVMSATHKTYPALQNTWAVEFSIIANSIVSLTRIVTIFVEMQASMSDSAFWAGYSYIGFSYIAGVYLLPNMSSGTIEAAAIAAFEPISTYVDMHPGEVSLTLRPQAFPSFQAWRNFVYCQNANESGCTDSTGSYATISSRLLPKSLLKHNATELALSFIQILSHGVDQIIGHLVGGRAASLTNVDNAVNPAWRTSLWHVILVSTWTSDEACAATEANKRWLVTSANGLLRQLTPHSGCYMNEADFNEPNWQTSFFGSNFERLTAIKKQVDPQGLFSCWKCIGS